MSCAYLKTVERDKPVPWAHDYDVRQTDYSKETKRCDMMLRPLWIVAILAVSTAACLPQTTQTRAQSSRTPCTANDPRVLCDPRALQTLGWADSPYVTPDGNTLLMMYTPWNFWPTFTGGSPAKLGPDRPGHKSNANPWNDSNVYQSKRQQDGTWSSPVNLWFNDANGQCCAMVTSTGKVYFTKNIAGLGNQIFSAVPGSPAVSEDGVNSAANDNNPWVSADDKMIFFESDRPGGFGGTDIWFSYRDASGNWVTPVNMGPAVNTAANETQPWASGDGSALFFNREGVAGFPWALWTGGQWVQQSPLALDARYSAEISFNATMSSAYFAISDTTAQSILFVQSNRSATGWGPAATTLRDCNCIRKQ
jgi:hypothetical protein